MKYFTKSFSYIQTVVKLFYSILISVDLLSIKYSMLKFAISGKGGIILDMCGSSFSPPPPPHTHTKKKTKKNEYWVHPAIIVHQNKVISWIILKIISLSYFTVSEINILAKLR